MNYLLKTVVVASLLIWTVAAEALEPWAPTEKEMRRLPPYCKAKLVGDNNAEVTLWRQKLGEGYMHIHHYCVALNFMMRGDRSWKDKQNQKFNYNRARGNIQYMFDHTSSNYFMWPEFHLKMGEVLIKLGDGSKGAAEFQKAINFKPDYAPPYRSLSDYYKKLGLMDRARETLVQGLEHIPDSKSLKRKLKRLDKATKSK